MALGQPIRESVLDKRHKQPGSLSYRQVPILLFVVGVTVAVVAWKIPALHQVYLDLANAGYAGIFVAGIMYGSSFTSTAASIIFAHVPATMNIFLVGIVGAVGAMMYDLVVFILVRRMSHRIFFADLIARWHHRQMPRWLASIIGGLIIASPLPDELASGLLGLESISRRRFAIISFLGNMVGIIVIDALF